MCGIYFSCNRSSSEEPSQRLRDRLSCRGPDASWTIKFSPHAKHGSIAGWYATALSTVLSLRSDQPVVQPIMSEPNSPMAPSFFMWNGEAWKYDGEILHSHDSTFVHQELIKATNAPLLGAESLQSCKQKTVRAILGVFSKISGPYAFVFFDCVHDLLFFGRDVLGRRSLLIRKSGNSGFELVSVCAGLNGFEEVGSDGLHYVDFSLFSDGASTTPFQDNDTCPLIVHVPWQKEGKKGDSNNLLPYPFPALNLSDISSTGILNTECPEIDNLVRLLKVSLQLRLKSAPMKRSPEKDGDRIAILFSGGLDCTLLARIAHDILPYDQQIDLLNVAFENPRVVNAASKLSYSLDVPRSAYEACPDRITGRASYTELCRICPERFWQFLPINVPFEELTEHRLTIIELLYPHDTEMDFSIGCALYFAARGRGVLQRDLYEDAKSYVTPAQVLISGLGADELFGGYSRHAVAHQRKGHQGLIHELQIDFERIAQRNLGRDDRVISHWGKEVRYPFLDEDIVSWALSIPACLKCNFDQGIDEDNGLDASKRLLRLAAWRLGLRQAAQQKKRAIQFGARTAKMTVGRTKGTQKIENTM